MGWDRLRRGGGVSDPPARLLCELEQQLGFSVLPLCCGQEGGAQSHHVADTQWPPLRGDKGDLEGRPPAVL